jgi:hypothetical protein
MREIFLNRAFSPLKGNTFLSIFIHAILVGFQSVTLNRKRLLAENEALEELRRANHTIGHIQLSINRIRYSTSISYFWTTNDAPFTFLFLCKCSSTCVLTVFTNIFFRVVGPKPQPPHCIAKRPDIVTGS